MATLQWCFFITAFLLTLSLASPLNLANSPNYRRLSPRDKDHPTWGCHFQGNSDLYGLGIRVGIYMQLFSSLLANAALPSHVREDMQNTNAIIMVSVFAGMANATIRRSLNAVEIFVMSTFLAAFMWSDFTPAHISNIMLSSKGGKCRVQTEESGGMGERGEEELWEKKSYFAAISRSIFGTAFAVFNVWYWLFGRHSLLKNGIDNPTCQPIIFLHAQIILNGYQPMLYIILSVAYAIYEVVFMVWWVVILTPGTLRLAYDIIAIVFMSIMTPGHSRMSEIRSKFAQWYLGFARLHPKTLKIFDRVKMTIQTRKKLRKAL